MSSPRYRFPRDGDVGAAVRRIARDRAETAVARLRTSAADDAPKAVHDTRKDLKKLRSLLRLVRTGLGEQRYRAENARYRDAARELAAPRDAEVKLATLADLRRRYRSEMPAAEALQQALEDERKKVAADGSSLSSRIARAAEAIEAGAGDIDDWDIAGEGFPLIRPGLERAYRKGRNALRAVRADPTDEAVHEWRKRVKDLWYDLRLLRDSWPAAMKAVAAEAAELSDVLGDHNDLVVLMDDARAKAPDDPEVEVIATLARRRQGELLEEALLIGDRLYAEKPAEFTRRLERYWQAWRAE
jgi:CHAD domain-containing protein